MDDFQQAAATAQSRYTAVTWTALPLREQAQAIYAELRRIDAERVTRAIFPQRRRPRTRTVTSDAFPAHAD
jgi:hypothetical protein